MWARLAAGDWGLAPEKRSRVLQSHRNILFTGDAPALAVCDRDRGPACRCVAMDEAAPFLLLGVMSNPVKPLLRTQWREWASNFHDPSVRVRYVFGKTVYERNADPGSLRVESVATDLDRNDHMLVDGRERLPHVGVVTEKSAYFWMAAAAAEPSAKWYCKCDDDTLVHLDRLARVLRSIDALHPGEATYLGHMKWRGWDVDHRFQACGGTWGEATKTAKDILYGGIEHGTKRYPPCPHAAGPYPYMSGGMVCMSRPLALRMASDALFRDFVAVARQRNTAGTPCKRPLLCANQPPEVHMWHHEDAGIGYNVFRAVVAGNASINYIAVPAHYNDAGIIERRTAPGAPLSANDEYWSTRAVFAHGIKAPAHFALIKQRWNLSRPDAVFSNLKCWPCDQLPRGANIHYGNWKWARVPCPQSSGVGRFCDVRPPQHFTCCSFPWIVPESMKQRTGAKRAARQAAQAWEEWKATHPDGMAVGGVAAKGKGGGGSRRARRERKRAWKAQDA